MKRGRPPGFNVNGSSTAARILDFLETHDGMWYTLHNLSEWIPDRSPATIRRAISRLNNDGLIEKRVSLIPAKWPPDYPPKGHKYPGVRQQVEYRVPDRTHLDKLYQRPMQ